MNIYDVGIIGAGVAGSFACLKLSEDYKDLKTIVFDIGRPPAKRRSQINGWLGCLPNSDGKLYMNNLDRLSEIVGLRKTKTAHNFVKNILSQINSFKVIKDKSPSISAEKKIVKLGYDILLNNFIQIYPKDIHLLSKQMTKNIEENVNITFCFDMEVINIVKQKGIFTITTEDEKQYKCRKLVMAVGRAGWRWATKIYSDFGLIKNDDTAKYGVRVEMDADHMKDFNKSNCSLIREDIEIGPISWNGTVIPEDHVDLAISAFRSNEPRWQTDKVSFSMIGNVNFPEKGFYQTDRLGKLTFVITNDRIIKEKISHIMTGKSKISVIPEYDWLKKSIRELSSVIPEIANKAYFHAPTITPMIPKINIDKNLMTDIEGLYCCGESMSLHGILGAMCSGTMVADSVAK